MSNLDFLPEGIEIIDITSEGYRILRESLQLLEAQQAELLASLATMSDETNKAHDNAAREQTVLEIGVLGTQISTLKDQLSRARILEIQQEKIGTIKIGSTVTIKFVDSNETVMYLVSDPVMTNPRAGIISYKSPLGQAVLGKEKGTKVEISVPGEEPYEVEIIDVI
jgi:transcription elongation factor GreA